jgi:two-component system sensor histidine kinase/response regulator
MISLASLIYAGSVIAERRDASDVHDRAQLLVDTIQHRRSELSDAMQAYVITGNVEYRRTVTARHTHTADERTETPDNLGLDKSEQEMVARLLKISKAMSAIEQGALQAWDGGDGKGAAAMLFADEYLRMKASALDTSQQLQVEMDRRRTADLAALSEKAVLARAMLAGSIALTVLTVLGALYGFYLRRVVLPLTKITEKTELLLRGTRGVKFMDDSSRREATEISALQRALTDYRDMSIAHEEQRALLARLNDEQAGIFNTATVGIMLVRERHIRRCNTRLEEIFGYPDGTMAGTPATALYESVEDYLEAGKAINEALAGHRVESSIRQFVRMDGSKFWGRISARLINEADPDSDLLAVIEDVTKERLAEQELRDAKLVAEDAANTKSEFLANMSHEIRTPMNAIIGMTHLMAKTTLNPRQRDYLNKIAGAGQHLLAVINDILDFSKAESGKLEIEHIEFNVDKLLSHVSMLLGEKATSKGLELSISIAPDVPRNLIGDSLRIEQILLNYCSNAIKFTERGEVQIACTVATPQAGDDTEIHFAVHDSGPGLTEETAAGLFQSFHQADASTTRKHGGTGLGLAISKRLAELMGGTVGVRSVPGRGSTFWFKVRLGTAVGNDRELVPAAGLRGKRVLVVDDNLTTATVLETMLGSMTFITRTANSGATAIEEVRRAESAGEPYDVILLDWHMAGGMDGIDTARQIRALMLLNQPHLLMVTAHGSEDLMYEAGKAGIESFLIKPITPSLLFETLMQLLSPLHEQTEVDGGSPAGTRASLDGIRGASILVVEDNEMNQDVARELLDDAGFNVEIAENGAIAVVKVQSSRYDLVFMDMQMPVMDGLSATRAIRSLPGMGDLPIVAMTANAMQRDREACLAAGMNDYIAKPFDADDLWSALTRWIRPDAARAREQAIRSAPADHVAQASDTVMRAVREAIATDATARLAEEPIPHDIPGLDAAEGLRRVNGKASLYAALLRKFAARKQAAALDARTALRAGHRDEALHVVHTIKGVAGTIGAGPLQALAARLEEALRKDSGASGEPGARADDIDAMLDELSRQLTSMTSAINARLPEPDTTAADGEVDRDKLAVLCAQLQVALTQDDMIALRMLQDNRSLLRAAFAADFEFIDSALQRMDFSAALDALCEACRRMDVPLARAA